MNKPVSIFFAFVLVFSLLLGTMPNANASEIMPYADSEFNSATTLLKATKQVSFRAVTYSVKSSISVSACWLEKKNNDGTWSTVCPLPTPSFVASETFAYATTVDYSDYIGTGTYRIRATYNADGHTITRYSNERTF